MKDVYLHHMACVSPLRSPDDLAERTLAEMQDTPVLRCIEPDYSTRIDAKLNRRMSRIIRMGYYSAMECLGAAGIMQPDAIISATGLGSLEDTGIFLEKMIRNKEEMLAPTAFIQSTHNALAAQIGLSLGNTGYNHTWVQGGISFECAMEDAVSLLSSDPDRKVLLTAADELTHYSIEVLKQFGLAGSGIENEHHYPGVPAGEGAVSMIVSHTPVSNNSIRLMACEPFFAPEDETETYSFLRNMLKKHGLHSAAKTLLLSGRNGGRFDAFYAQAENEFFSNANIIHFKSFCGEYPTAAAFASWLAWKQLTSTNKNRPDTVVVLNRDPRGYCSLMAFAT